MNPFEPMNAIENLKESSNINVLKNRPQTQIENIPEIKMNIKPLIKSSDEIMVELSKEIKPLENLVDSRENIVKIKQIPLETYMENEVSRLNSVQTINDFTKAMASADVGNFNGVEHYLKYQPENVKQNFQQNLFETRFSNSLNSRNLLGKKNILSEESQERFNNPFSTAMPQGIEGTSHFIPKEKIRHEIKTLSEEDENFQNQVHYLLGNLKLNDLKLLIDYFELEIPENSTLEEIASSLILNDFDNEIPDLISQNRKITKKRTNKEIQIENSNEERNSKRINNFVEIKPKNINMNNLNRRIKKYYAKEKEDEIQTQANKIFNDFTEKQINNLLNNNFDENLTKEEKSMLLAERNYKRDFAKNYEQNYEQNNLIKKS